MKIRVKVFTNANAEIVTIDNVNVPEVGVTVSILPVELISFESYWKAKDLRLTWRTASESNNAGYDVERSEDSKNFSSIAWIVGNGMVPPQKLRTTIATTKRYRQEKPITTASAK